MKVGKVRIAAPMNSRSGVRIITKRIRIVVILALIAFAVGAFIMRGRAHTLAAVQGQVRELTPARAGLFWIEAPAQLGRAKAQLRFLPHGSRRTPEMLLEAYDIRSLAVQGETAYALIETEPGDATGQLVAQPRKGAMEVLLSGLHSPQGLIVTDRAVCWSESRAAPAEGIAHVPIMGRLTAIRVLPLSGEKPAPDATPRLLAMAESAEDHYSGQLLGARGGNFYWTERLAEQMPAAKTFLRRAPEAGGEPETVSLERGVHEAALGERYLYWTAQSDEMAAPSSGRTVRRRALGGGDIETLTDWLSPSGALVMDGDRAFYAGGGWLWSVPAALDKPRPIVRWGTAIPGTVSVYGGNVVGLTATESAKGITRQPISLRGYMTAAVPGAVARAAGRGGMSQ